VKHSRAELALALLALTASASTLVVAASLKDKPPEGLKLAGTQWQLDPYHSDDASNAIDRAARKASAPKSASRPGGVFGGDDPFGRHGSDPTGGTFPTDRSRPTDRNGSTDRSRSADRTTQGRWPDDGRNSTDIDPTGANQAMTMQWGTQRGSVMFEALRKNPDSLSFDEGTQSMTVSEDGLDTQCVAGKKEPFSDSYGDGERSCGWSGRAWVIETRRGRQFSRTDRYELSKDGRTLRYTTSATEDGMGRVTIERRYQIPIARDPERR
jgi:hypothetical protein